MRENSKSHSQALELYRCCPGLPRTCAYSRASAIVSTVKLIVILILWLWGPTPTAVLCVVCVLGTQLRTSDLARYIRLIVHAKPSHVLVPAD